MEHDLELLVLCEDAGHSRKVPVAVQSSEEPLETLEGDAIACRGGWRVESVLGVRKSA